MAARRGVMMMDATRNDDYRYCPRCAGALAPLVAAGRARLQCRGCGWIRYRNPTVGAAIALVERHELLIGQRGDGGFCIPCGHVEWDETVEAAAIREFLEETGLSVRIERLLAAHSNFHRADQHTVGVWYQGARYGGELRAGGDLAAVRFYRYGDLPPLCFPTDRLVVDQLHREGLL